MAKRSGEGALLSDRRNPPPGLHLAMQSDLPQWKRWNSVMVKIELCLPSLAQPGRGEGAEQQQ
jgi:hypothetical protein